MFLGGGRGFFPPPFSGERGSACVVCSRSLGILDALCWCSSQALAPFFEESYADPTTGVWQSGARKASPTLLSAVCLPHGPGMQTRSISVNLVGFNSLATPLLVCVSVCVHVWVGVGEITAGRMYGSLNEKN